MSFVSEDKNLINEYVNLLLLEFELHLRKGYRFDLKTIYFGGGTPSILHPELIIKIVETIKKKLSVSSPVEITVECNPETYRYEEFLKLTDHGINRISIGNQSFLEKNLKVLGRKHTPNHTLKMVEDAVRAGIENVNLDMIYTIPGQSLKELEEDLKIYTSLPITHISAYMLTAYENTPFRAYIEKGILNLPDEDTATQMFFLINEYLEEKGFYRYELSNWAKKGFECKHNLLYWTDRQFLGIGVSAWSYVENKRFGNTRNFEKYMYSLRNRHLPVEYTEYITEKERKKERIFLGLRLRKGIPISEIDNKEKVEELVKNGYAFKENENFVLTPNGLVVLNEISRFLLNN